MRLINTKTLALELFPSEKDRPYYLILSHRWGDDEITYQELCEVIAFKKTSGPNEFAVHNIKRKKGWQKFETFCKEALRRGCDWAWMDTCCIDKTSQSELSEAINSMWKWYKRAISCIVYLGDVDINTVFDRDHPQRFTNSQWFTRGWTLQELVAPNNVGFYDRNWLCIGDKMHLKDLIGHATGIAPAFLRAPEWASIAQKFSWASTRNTTRAEDAAYCLMGLVDVNMPLLYGEGFERAFRRLQLEIIRSSSDQSILAWYDDKSRPGWHPRRDILAKSLAPFGRGDDIVWTSFSHKPYTMTNKGLEITTELFTVADVVSQPKNPYFLMPLNCARKSAHNASRLYLVIQQGAVKDDVYHRYGLLCEARPPSAKPHKAKTIYLHDGPNSRPLNPFLTASVFELSSLSPVDEAYGVAKDFIRPRRINQSQNEAGVA